MPLRRPVVALPAVAVPLSVPLAVALAVCLPLVLGGCAAVDDALGVGPAAAASREPEEAAELEARLGDAWPPVRPAEVAVTVSPRTPDIDWRVHALSPEGACGVGVDRFQLDTGPPRTEGIERTGGLAQATLVSGTRPVAGTPVAATLTLVWSGPRGTVAIEGDLVLDEDGTTAGFTGQVDALVVDARVRCTDLPPA